MLFTARASTVFCRHCSHRIRSENLDMMHPCMSKLDARPQWGSTLRSTGRRYASASSMVSAPPPSRTVAKPRHRRSSDLSLLLPWKAGATHDAGDATGPQGGVVPSTEHSRHQKRMKKEPKPDDVVRYLSALSYVLYPHDLIKLACLPCCSFQGSTLHSTVASRNITTR